MFLSVHFPTIPVCFLISNQLRRFYVLTDNQTRKTTLWSKARMKRTPFIATMVLLFSLFTGFAYAEPATININTADVETLASLDGIGQSKAEAIVAYRDANGPFQSSTDLTNVKGIGDATVAKNTERMTVK